jgi:hypothetical protein
MQEDIIAATAYFLPPNILPSHHYEAVNIIPPRLNAAYSISSNFSSLLPSRWARSEKPPQGAAVPPLRMKSQSASRNAQAVQTRPFNPSRVRASGFAEIPGLSWDSFLPFLMSPWTTTKPWHSRSSFLPGL